MQGLVGKEHSKHTCSEPPQGWNIVNIDLFLLALVVGSFTEAPRGQALSARLQHSRKWSCPLCALMSQNFLELCCRGFGYSFSWIVLILS